MTLCYNHSLCNKAGGDLLLKKTLDNGLSRLGDWKVIAIDVEQSWQAGAELEMVQRGCDGGADACYNMLQYHCSMELLQFQ
jgi:hypothetical protein